MRAKKGRALKQALTIVLLIATISMRLLPDAFVHFPRSAMLDVVAAPAAPLHYITRGFLSMLAVAPPAPAASPDDFRRLSEELAQTRSELTRARQALESASEFRSLLGRSPIYVWNASISGYIVGADTDVFSRTYIVSAGTYDGVTKGLPVALGKTAIGVVSDAGIYHSRVRILADPQSRICVRFAKSGAEGVLAGVGRRNCLVRFVSNDLTAADIPQGDYVLTSGLDGIFPPDLLVGTVARFYARPAEPDAYVEVELFADFSAIQTCLILKRTSGPGAR